MDWTNYIASNEEILLSKLCIKGTRISVKLLLELMETGWRDAQILENYPNLQPIHLEAVRTYKAVQALPH